jgi:hypothetical protein
MPHRCSQLTIFAGLFLAMSGVALGAAKPKKGEPFPAGPSTVPYEDVLDHCDLAIYGKVKRLAAGRVEVEDVKVLKGKYEGDRAVIRFSGEWRRDMSTESMKIPVPGATGTFLVIQSKDGKLLLAGLPPKGGGYVEEGPELVKKLLVAAKDPAAGFKSKDFSVKLSSAYRLLQAWMKAPKDARPKLQAGLMETLVKGLVPATLRGRHVNAGARDSINANLGCNILRLTRYSVNHSDLKREANAEKIKEMWERTVKALKARRAGKPDPDALPKVEPGKLKKRAQELIKQLGSDDYDVREKADKQLRTIAKKVKQLLVKGSESSDVEVSDRCKAILKALAGKGTAVTTRKLRFDLDLAEHFVPRKVKKPKAAAPKAETIKRK